MQRDTMYQASSIEKLDARDNLRDVVDQYIFTFDDRIGTAPGMTLHTLFAAARATGLYSVDQAVAMMNNVHTSAERRAIHTKRGK